MPRTRLLIAAAAAFTVACDGGVVRATDPDDTVATISMSAAVTKLAVRQELQLAPVFRDATGRELVNVVGVTWTSSDPSTISVDQTGVVRAVKLGGPVTITATKDAGVATLSFPVVPLLKFDPPISAVAEDSLVQFHLVHTDYFGATIGPIGATWSSTNAGVASVSSTGVVTGVATGFTSISASVQGESVNALVEVGVISPFDGEWRGAPFGAATAFSQSTVTSTVLFGSVRAFTLAFSYVPPGAPNVTCIGDYKSQSQVNAVSGVFSVPVVPRLRPLDTYGTMGFTVNGQFGVNSLLVSFPSVTIPVNAFYCNGTIGILFLQNVSTEAVSFSAGREAIANQ